MAAVSIVIVNHNSGSLLKACIESVLASDIPIEIVIVDNASDDDSTMFLTAVASQHRLNVIYNEENLGFSKAINQGVSLSQTQYILMLNPDCLVYPHTAQSLLQILKQDPSAAIAGGLVFNFDGSEQKGCRRREPTIKRSISKVMQWQSNKDRSNNLDMKNEPLPAETICVDAVSGAFLMVRKRIFCEIGGMDERFFLHFEDLDLCRRARIAGWRVLFVPNVSIFHFQGASATRFNVSTEKYKSMYRYQCKHNVTNVIGRCLLYLLIWVHFLICSVLNSGMTRKITKMERDADIEIMIALPAKATKSIKHGNSDILVIGSLNEYSAEVLDYAREAGWYIFGYPKDYTCNNYIDVSWISYEYIKKAPKSDLPKFNRLIIDSSVQFSAALKSWLSLCQIERVAVIDCTRIYGSVSIEESLAQQVELVDSARNGLDMCIQLERLGVRGGQTFPLLGSQGVQAYSHPEEVNNRASPEECFSWLSS